VGFGVAVGAGVGVGLGPTVLSQPWTLSPLRQVSVPSDP
jgi:hypothetical protein